MRFAILTGVWLVAWGAFAPARSGAGFVLSADAALTPIASANSLGEMSSQSVPQSDPLSQVDNPFTVLEVPSGATAPPNTNPLTGGNWAPAIADSGPVDLQQSSVFAYLPPDAMLSLKQMYKSAVFRPPRV